jgi:hypothetical protein
MAILTVNDVVISLPEGFILPTDSQPDGQRVADDAESWLAKRTKRSNANKATMKKKTFKKKEGARALLSI